MPKKSQIPEEAPEPANDLNNLQALYLAALAEWEVLKVEYAGINKQLETAGRAGDVAAIHRLRQRADELPDYLEAAELKVIAAAQARDEFELAESQARLGPAVEELGQLEARFKEAETALTEARWELEGLNGRVHVLASEIGARKRRQEALIAKATRRHAPIVRSAWQGQTA